MGYELVHVEILNARQKTLRVFIDRLAQDSVQPPATGITIEDCVTVARALDPELDTTPAVDALFNGAGYELEVSSPGVDRPLRSERDYARFLGRDARIHVYRPLTAEELGNPEYAQLNPKQKHFVGTLIGIEGGKVQLSIPLEGSTRGRPTKPGKKAKPLNEKKVAIPLSLISKANLEPCFDLGTLSGNKGVEI
jgi:ribosome maturation factor RimP